MLTKCRLCNLVNKSKIVFNDKNTKYCVIICTKCGFGSLHPLPTISHLSSMYTKKYFDKWLNMKTSEKEAEKRIDFVLKLQSPGRLLDFGCGLGSFLAASQKQGFKVEGWDISEYAAKYNQKKYKILVKHKALKKNLYKPNSFDIVTAFEVLEHIINFKQILLYWHKWLKPNGLLFISTPSLDQWDALLMRKHWYGFKKIPQHVNYFSTKTIKLLLKQQGFNNIKIYKWGYVRSLGFVLKNIGLPSWFTTKTFFWPMTSIMIVAKKNEQRKI